MSPLPTDPNQAQAWITGDPPDQTIDFYIPRGNTGPIGPQGPIGPSLIVGDVVTNMGPAAPGTIGPQGLQGVKGDPGGLVATAITSGQDLNAFVNSGYYSCGDGSFATLALNYPLALKAGQLLVMRAHSGLIHQTYFVSDGPYARTMFQRVWASSAWQPWRAYASARVDQTAGRAIYQWDDVNQREQLVYGDTGVRRIDTTLINGWTAAIATLRRTNNMVQLGLYSVNPSAKTADIMYSIPPGFRPGAYGGTISAPCRSLGPGGISWCSVNATGDVYPDNVYTTFNGSIQLLTWMTADTWPTTLPGTASGGIPNV